MTRFIPFVLVPLQPHFEHVVLSTASSVILLPVWSLNCLRRLASCLQSHTDNNNTNLSMQAMQRHTYVHMNTQNTNVSTYSALTLFGSKSRPVPWLTAFIEKDNFTLSPRIWETGNRATVNLLTHFTDTAQCLCVCVCVVTSLPMTLIHTCSPTSTISEAFSTREADISLTCTRPVMRQGKSIGIKLKNTQNNEQKNLDAQVFLCFSDS